MENMPRADSNYIQITFSRLLFKNFTISPKKEDKASSTILFQVSGKTNVEIEAPGLLTRKCEDKETIEIAQMSKGCEQAHHIRNQIRNSLMMVSSPKHETHQESV
jgi:hypothetical protein